MNNYFELKMRQQKEIDNFPMKFAFNEKQFEESMKELGLTEYDLGMICAIGGGGFIRKTDKKALDEMFTRFVDEMQKEIDADPTGEGFIYQMFDYELANHEFSYTRDFESTLDALDLTLEEIEKDPKLSKGFCKAIRNQLRDDK
ncbi:MAG: DUF7659 family protein [Fusobacteriaceae bacterium]